MTTTMDELLAIGAERPMIEGFGLWFAGAGGDYGNGAGGGDGNGDDVDAADDGDDDDGW